jgi:thiol-disulfide isomerase/thioredoxin
VKPGQPVVVSELYNAVFTDPAERAVLNRLFDTFFKVPLYLAQHVAAAGKPPSLREVSEQFRFEVPGEADVMLRIMESDPRMPRFFTRDPATGEITSVDVDRILAHPRFGKALERTITGWEGRPAPAFATTTYDGQPLTSESLSGKPQLLYFWFTGCPPCVRTAPLLAELDREFGPRGLRVVGLNADRALDLPYADEDRAAYAKKHGWTFTLAHATPGVQDAYGAVSVFPTFFFVDRKGVVVRQLVNFQEKETLERACRVALE